MLDNSTNCEFVTMSAIAAMAAGRPAARLIQTVVRTTTPTPYSKEGSTMAGIPSPNSARAIAIGTTSV
jgi:hypothetical protein